MYTVVHLKKQVYGIVKFISPSFCRRSYGEVKNNSTTLDENEFEEISVPVPWGHISCVHWGPKDKQPILALHGWQDNANTWKPLIKHLPSNLSLLAIDSPGHGKSSWYPPGGMFYNFNDNIIIARRLVKYFGWKSTSFLGHSMGAITSFKYASLYPEEVNFIILLDNLKPITSRRKNHLNRIGSDLDKLLVIDERNIKGDEPPSYENEIMIEKLHEGSEKSIDKDKCHILLERAISKSLKFQNKYFFTRDSRLKHYIHIGYDADDVRLMAALIKCPIMHIKFESWSYYEPKENYDEIVEILKKSNANFELYILPGKHHAHFNNPEIVAPYICDFIEKCS